jgi:hypothetical protein
MAVPANLAQNQSSAVERTNWSPVQLMAAELLGQGLNRITVAKRLNGHLLTKRQRTFPPRRQRQFQLKRLREWQRDKRFRDLTWEYSMAWLDAQAPEIAQGVARKGKSGRVDAAKFGLELAGRYTPRGTDTPTAVNIVFGGLPRPQVEEVVDGSVVREEDG